MLRIYYIREFCILPSCNFLHPDPITQYPDSCRASHSDLVQYSRSVLLYLEELYHSTGNGHSYQYSLRSVCNQRPTVPKGQAQQQECPQQSANLVCNGVCREEACVQARCCSFFQIALLSESKSYRKRCITLQIIVLSSTESVHISIKPRRTA